MGNFAGGAAIRNTYPAQAGADSRPEVGLSRGFTLHIRLRLRLRLRVLRPACLEICNTL